MTQAGHHQRAHAQAAAQRWPRRFMQVGRAVASRGRSTLKRRGPARPSADAPIQPEDLAQPPVEMKPESIMMAKRDDFNIATGLAGVRRRASSGIEAGAKKPIRGEGDRDPGSALDQRGMVRHAIRNMKATMAKRRAGYQRRGSPGKTATACQAYGQQAAGGGVSSGRSAACRCKSGTGRQSTIVVVLRASSWAPSCPVFCRGGRCYGGEV